jgi:serine/threonine protein kinase
MKKIADVLGAAHRMNILHRDIKPANIILTNEGEPKLADLGLAKLLEESEDADSLTMEGQTLGTPHFIAPEQVDAGEVDARTDLYGLGCTFFRLMTGEYVYQSEVAIAAVLLAQSTKPARKVRDVRPELSPHTEAIIDKCLQKKKEDRYEYAGQLIEDIDAVLAGKPPVHAKPPQPKRAAPKRAAGDAPGAGKRPRRAAARAKGKSGCLVVLAALTVTVGSLLLALL